jgi:hypothetical protein
MSETDDDVLLMWTEPRLVTARLRTPWEWTKLILLCGTLFTPLSMATFWILSGGPGPALLPWMIFPIFHLGFTLAMVGLAEAIQGPGVIVVRSGEISRYGRMSEAFKKSDGQSAQFLEWSVRLSTMKDVEIERPRDERWPWAVLRFSARGQSYRLAIPPNMTPERVAELLHDGRVPVRLDGWNSPPLHDPPPAPTGIVVETIEFEHALNRGTRFWIDAVLPNIVGVPLLILALGLFVSAWWFHGDFGIPGSVGCVVGGVLTIALAVGHDYAYGMMPSYGAMRRLTRRTLAQRGDAWVDVNDPSAWCVEVIPRANWFRMAVHHYDDVGFVIRDAKGEYLVYEGLRERWRAPLAALAPLRAEKVSPQGEEAFFMHYFVMVVAGIVDGAPWERPLCPLPAPSWRWQTNERRLHRMARMLETLVPSH